MERSERNKEFNQMFNIIKKSGVISFSLYRHTNGDFTVTFFPIYMGNIAKIVSDLNYKVINSKASAKEFAKIDCTISTKKPIKS